MCPEDPEIVTLTPMEPAKVTHVVDDFVDIEKQDLDELRLETGKRNKKKGNFVLRNIVYSL